jgi:hypothetical protein
MALYISIVTLNKNRFNSPIKSNRVAICCLSVTHLYFKGTHRLKVKG